MNRPHMAAYASRAGRIRQPHSGWQVHMQQGALYMIGWRGRQRSRRWQVSYCDSLDQATEIARAHTRFDGGG